MSLNEHKYYILFGNKEEILITQIYVLKQHLTIIANKFKLNKKLSTTMTIPERKSEPMSSPDKIKPEIINKIEKKFNKEIIIICDKFCPKHNSNKVPHTLYPAQLKLHEFIYDTAKSIELNSIITEPIYTELGDLQNSINLYLQREVYDELETLIEEINPKAFSKPKKNTLFIQMQEEMEKNIYNFIKKKFQKKA